MVPSRFIDDSANSSVSGVLQADCDRTAPLAVGPFEFPLPAGSGIAAFGKIFKDADFKPLNAKARRRARRQAESSPVTH
jgi:hypothetical protein